MIPDTSVGLCLCEEQRYKSHSAYIDVNGTLCIKEIN